MLSTKWVRALAVVICAAGLFWAGVAAGQNKFGTPSTIISVSIIKWKDGVPDAEKQKALEGVKDMARQIPGMKNVWIKAVRVQPREYNDIFVIEFESKEAAEVYRTHPVHEKWSTEYLKIREASISPQISN